MNQSQNDVSEKAKTKAKAKAKANPIVEEAKQTSLLQPTEGSMEVVPATNKKANAKAKKNNKDKESTGNLGSVPEGAVASASASLETPALTSENRQDSGIRFCPVCRYYLYLEVSGEDQSLHRLCRNCGHREEDTKGGMVMEMMVQERSAEGYKILLNEFTRQDPRLPHIRKNIKCPEPTCDSNHGKKDPDIIYIKYDAVNMLYLYICDICGFQWRSARS